MSDAATPAKKKSAAPKKVATHPPIAVMVTAAITALKDRKGSSLAAIKKHVAANKKVDIAKMAPFIRKFLKKAVADGKLVQTKGAGAAGSFKIGKVEKPKKKPVAKKEKKAKKPKATPKKPVAKKAAKSPKKAAKKPVKKAAAKPKKAATPAKKAAAKKPAAKKVAKKASPKKPAAKKPAAKKAAKK